MEIDSEHVPKEARIESSQGSDIIIQEKTEEVEGQGVPLQESICTIQHMPIIHTTQENEEGIQTKSSTNIASQYNNMRLQTKKSIEEKFPEVKGKVKNKPIVLSTLNYDENVFNLVVL